MSEPTIPSAPDEKAALEELIGVIKALAGGDPGQILFQTFAQSIVNQAQMSSFEEMLLSLGATPDELTASRAKHFKSAADKLIAMTRAAPSIQIVSSVGNGRH